MKLYSRYILIFSALGVLSQAAGLKAQNPLTEKIRQQVSAYFARTFSVQESDLNITYLRLPDVNNPDGDRLHLEVYSQLRSKKMGYQTIWVRVTKDGKLVLKSPVSVDVSLNCDVLVADRKIGRHTVITEDMLQVEHRTIRDDWDKLITKKDQLIGKEARRVIQQGTLFKTDLVRTPPVVHRGDRIKAKILFDTVAITTPAIARGEGSIGDVIRIKSEQTGKNFFGEIQSDNLVIVQRD